MPGMLRRRLHWMMLGLVAALGAAVATTVDLQPRVSGSFFFSSRDPAFRQEQRIRRLFPTQDQLILSVSGPRIESEEYLDRIERLGDALAEIPGVIAVKSVRHGPDDLDDARESPLWRRLLLARDGRATNVIVLAKSDAGGALVRRIEQIVDRMEQGEFAIRMTGPPYIAEMIRRNLVRDFRRFNVAAAVVFGIMIAVVFRSFRIWLGAFASCLAAVMLTLIVQDRFGSGIGILTANLTTIVFVLTQSHVVYLTGNWWRLAREGETDGEDLAARAWRTTAAASFWAGVTTLLGFGSLLLVDAKPLRELGAGGAVGTVAAFLCAYLVYPPFLRWARPPATARGPAPESPGIAGRPRLLVGIAAGVVVACIALGAGLSRLQTDPSLLDYFDPDGRLHSDLASIDYNGGSSPLTLVVRDDSGAKLNTSEAYDEMWRLQRALEEDDAVGATISLPVLMAESNRSPLSFLLSWENLLRVLERPEFGRVAESFVTDDRKLALFLLRMNETARSQPRMAVVERLEATTRSNGFEPVMVGGIYYLQGRLAELVRSSLVQGLAGLLGLFAVVALLASRSVGVALAITAVTALVPLAILGTLGWARVPLDVISAPAANVAVGIAVDAMIHLTAAARRTGALARDPGGAWRAALREQRPAIVSSAVILSAGFAFFGLSAFPPTRRFGLAVVLGTVVATLGALFVLPALAAFGGNLFRRRVLSRA